MIELVPVLEAVDEHLWWALRGDLRLAGMPCPRDGFPFKELAERYGIDTVVSLLGDVSYDCSPLRLEAFTLQDLYGGAVPSDPDAELERVIAAAQAVRRLLDEGQGVVVHCAGGTGRTGTVIGAVLVSLGLSVDEVAAWLNSIHQRRGRSGWPESGWQSSVLSCIA
jgi:hypothetical protein